MKVTAKARRSGGWWAIEVPDVPGAFTQAKRLDQVAEAAASAVADILDIDDASIEVELDVDLPGNLQVYVESAKTSTRLAQEAQAQASALMRDAVTVLRADGSLSTRDVALLLGVTHQRVAQLAAEATGLSGAPLLHDFHGAVSGGVPDLMFTDFRLLGSGLKSECGVGLTLPSFTIWTKNYDSSLFSHEVEESVVEEESSR